MPSKSGPDVKTLPELDLASCQARKHRCSAGLPCDWEDNNTAHEEPAHEKPHRDEAFHGP